MDEVQPQLPITVHKTINTNHNRFSSASFNVNIVAIWYTRLKLHHHDIKYHFRSVQTLDKTTGLLYSLVQVSHTEALEVSHGIKYDKLLDKE